MIERRIRLVFDAMAKADVACLLMGGQACVLYGAAEFSKDVDFLVLADGENLNRVAAAMDSLRAEIIAVPDFKAEYLNEGLAVHFRCRAPGECDPGQGLSMRRLVFRQRNGGKGMSF